MIETWVFRENLDAFLRLLAHAVGYDYSEDDGAAIEGGVDSTNAETGDWFVYEIAGSQCILLLRG